MKTKEFNGHPSWGYWNVCLWSITRATYPNLLAPSLWNAGTGESPPGV